jgi:hypothetical protein
LSTLNYKQFYTLFLLYFVNKTKQEILHKQPLEPAAAALQGDIGQVHGSYCCSGASGQGGAGQGKVSVTFFAIKHILNRTGGGVHVMESLYFLSVTSKERCLYRGIHLVAVGSSVNTVSHGRETDGLEWIGKELQPTEVQLQQLH